MSLDSTWIIIGILGALSISGCYFGVLLFFFKKRKKQPVLSTPEWKSPQIIFHQTAVSSRPMDLGPPIPLYHSAINRRSLGIEVELPPAGVHVREPSQDELEKLLKGELLVPIPNDPHPEVLEMHEEIKLRVFQSDLEAVFEDRVQDLEGVRTELAHVWLDGCGTHKNNFLFHLGNVFGEDKVQTMSDTLRESLHLLYERGMTAGSKNRATLCINIARRKGCTEATCENHAYQLMTLPDKEILSMAREVQLHRYLNPQEPAGFCFGLEEALRVAEEQRENTSDSIQKTMKKLRFSVDKMREERLDKEKPRLTISPKDDLLLQR